MPFALLNHIGPPPENNKEAVKQYVRTIAAIAIVFGIAILLSAVLGE